MNNSEKQTWEKVRSAGRDQFLLRRIGRAVLVFLLGGTVVDIVWWFFTRYDPGSFLAAAAGWALCGVAIGAFLANNEWRTNERGYHESEPSEAPQ